MNRLNSVLVSQVNEEDAEGYYIIIPVHPSIFKEFDLKPDDFMNFLRRKSVTLVGEFLESKGF